MATDTSRATNHQRDRRIRQIEAEIVDATDQRYWNLSAELADLIAQSNAERGIHHTNPLNLQEPTEHPNDAFRRAMQAATAERQRLVADQTDTTPKSITGGTQRTMIVNV